MLELFGWKDDNEPNCIGYVYSRLGLSDEDRFIKPPTLDNLLKDFERVKGIEEASVLAVISFSEKTPRVAHIALVNDDKKTISHRPGIGRDSNDEELNKGLESFLDSDLDIRKVFYFKLKTKRK